MADTDLLKLEEAQNSALEEFYSAMEAFEAAQKEREEIEKSVPKWLTAIVPASQEHWDRLDAAKEREEKAMEAYGEAAKKAQDAADDVEKKKEELRANREEDVSYVVNRAKIECPFGLRTSYLTMNEAQGVYTRQIPQMTVCDTVLDENIINFGGCRSKENPSLLEAAEAAVEAAKKQIEDEGGWLDKFTDFVVGLFVKDQEMDVTDSLLEQCVGECKACFDANARWESGHEKVYVNGEQVLLRRCSLTCNYGGQVTILLSGQPE